MARKTNYKPFDVVYYRRPYGLEKYKAIVKVAKVNPGGYGDKYTIIPLEGDFLEEEIPCAEGMIYSDNEPLSAPKK